MKAINTFLIVMSTFFVMVFLPSGATAELGWYVCSVERAGPAGTGDKDIVNILLSDTADPQDFSGTWFQAPAGRQKEYLAVALTAISLNMNVRARIDPYKPELSQRIIERMYLMKE